MGRVDASHKDTLTDMAQAWDRFTGSPQLSEKKITALSWRVIFEAMTQYATATKGSLVLVFDEIQWMSKTGSGFVGSLKEAWQRWEPTGHIKVLICGSSNKFFYDHVGGDEKTLRGLKTHSDIWVHPFTPHEVKQYYFKKWSLVEVALVYMMIGGVPYYLNQIEPSQGFIHAINQAFFTKQTIFLEEIDELLKLEFYVNAQNTVKRILGALGQDGCELHLIVQKTGLSLATVSDALHKLLDYQIIFRKLPVYSKPHKNDGGYRYYMKDFYLNFYYQVLLPHSTVIKNNGHGLIFPYSILSAKTGYFINNFSGKAFELLMRYVLENKSDQNAKVFKVLQLSDANYTVESYWSVETQIDLVIDHAADRLTRCIECKWLGHAPDKNILSTLTPQRRPGKTPKTNNLRHYLALSQPWTANFEKMAEKQGIGLLGLPDIF